MKRTGFNGCIYDFSADYDSITVDDIKDIHKYLMKKNNIIWYVRVQKTLVTKRHIKMFAFIKKIFLKGLTFSSSLESITLLSSISMNN